MMIWRIGTKKLKVGIYGFTGCAGDQLAILHWEDELLDILNSVEIKSFLMAKSDNDEDAELDIAFVEGSISTKEQVEKIKEIRKRSKILVAIGNCACYGGVQLMYYDNDNYEERLKKVYGDIEFIHDTPIESKPISDYVKVDYLIPGCPISKEHFLPIFTKLINDLLPDTYTMPVCMECKWKENECLLMKGIPCLGPITSAGCGAICPTHNIPCIGCWGLVDDANIKSQLKLLMEHGMSLDDIISRMRIFGGKLAAEKLKEIVKERGFNDKNNKN